MSPETQVLMMNGKAGIYEKSRRARVEVISATMTSTKKMIIAAASVRAFNRSRTWSYSLYPTW